MQNSIASQKKKKKKSQPSSIVPFPDLLYLRRLRRRHKQAPNHPARCDARGSGREDDGDVRLVLFVICCWSLDQLAAAHVRTSTSTRMIELISEHAGRPLARSRDWIASTLQSINTKCCSRGVSTLQLTVHSLLSRHDMHDTIPCTELLTPSVLNTYSRQLRLQ